MGENLDCRGLACPAPVLKTKEAVDKGTVDRITVLLDNAAAKENVSRFLTRSGFEVSVAEKDGGLFEVTGSGGNGGEPEPAPMDACEMVACSVGPLKTMVLLGTNVLGRGDDDLGSKLIVNFVATLKEMGTELWRLVLLNAGVKLAIDGSGVLGELKALEESGVSILVCGTCLDHFGILERKQVGETTNMLDIVTSMQVADKVVNLT